MWWERDSEELGIPGIPSRSSVAFRSLQVILQGNRATQFFQKGRTAAFSYLGDFVISLYRTRWHFPCQFFGSNGYFSGFVVADDACSRNCSPQQCIRNQDRLPATILPVFAQSAKSAAAPTTR